MVGYLYFLIGMFSTLFAGLWLNHNVIQLDTNIGNAWGFILYLFFLVGISIGVGASCLIMFDKLIDIILVDNEKTK